MSGGGEKCGDPRWRRRILLAAWLLAAAGLLTRAAQVQVVQGAEWERVAERQHQRSLEIPAPRGVIRDRAGTALAVSHERIRVSVAPRELRKPEETASLLANVLGLEQGTASRVVRSTDPWVVLPGRYPPTVVEEFSGVRGVYPERELERLRPHGDLALGTIGRVRDDAGAGGVEQVFDSVLAGRSGREVQARDNLGRPIPGESFVVRPPRSGGEVVLTLDLDLQEIGRDALADAIEETGARGGDLVITDPGTGEILSMVSLGEGASGSLTAVNAPYEPGSTLKPFTVAGLLSRELRSLRDTVDAEEGRWRTAGRTLTDIEPHGAITVAEALRVSSNVGIAKAATAFTPAQQYETLRDFGFGAPTGIELPGEASGTLRRPSAWSRQSPASLAIGYEIGVTPIQMALAYGALANGGWLMEPRLVREIRASDGSTLERRRPRRVRRVLPAPVARRISDVLVDVVEEGTGTAARLGAFSVAGKSGTSRAYNRDGGYEEGGYYASFVGFFPADDPQLVVFVKLERPEGAYYGGSTAAPVTRTTLEAILAARQAPLDRRSLVAMVEPDVEEPAADGAVQFVSYRLPEQPPTAAERSTAGAVSGGGVPVPDVAGLPLRVAVRRIHSLGLRVRWEGEGAVTVVRPEPGVRLTPGDTVRIGSGS